MGAAMEITATARPAHASESEAPARPPVPLTYLSTAELAECTCPEPCERDHDRD